MCTLKQRYHISFAATIFFISLEPAATIPGRHLLEGGIDKLQLGNTYKLIRAMTAVQRPRGCELLIGGVASGL